MKQKNNQNHLGGDFLDFLKHCPLKAAVNPVEDAAGFRIRSRLILE